MKFSSLLAAMLILSGCAASYSGNDRAHRAEAMPKEKAGTLVVFSAENVGNESVGVLANEHFVAPLQVGKQFSQTLCSGTYELQARTASVSDENRVAYTARQQSVEIYPESVTYVELSRSANGWVLTPVTSEQYAINNNGGFAETENKWVRRLPDSMIKCQ